MMVTLLMWLHHHVSTTMTTTFQQDYGTFKSWLLSCTVPQPLKAPMPEDPFPIFTYAQSKEIHTYFLTTYFRHYHLYKYVFGPNPLPLEASFLGTRPPSSSSSSSTAVTAAMVALNGSEDGLAGGVEGLMMMMTPMGLAGGSEGGGTGAVGGEEKGMVGNSS
ncbi:hypothetical protein HMI56_005405 [Coelomomyces lativittatus]|nr:hypothetical protein HMI56_005405 [Coelomomyces lativittatus]